MAAPLGGGLLALLAVFLLAPVASPVSAEPVRDEILMLGFETFSTAQLPAGPGSAPTYPFGGYTEMVVLPSGRVLVAVPIGQPTRRIALKELLPDGSLRDLAMLAEPPAPYTEDRLHDMAVDGRGRLYVLTQTWFSASPPTVTRLVEVDPVSGATLGSKEVRENFHTIATAPNGLYGYDDTLLYPLDPDTGLIGPPLIFLPIGVHISEIEADSGGKLWLLANPVCETGGDEPCIYSLDLEEGTLERAPEVLYQNLQFLYEIAIRRRCVETSTVRCLQDGRFRAEIEFSDYAGVAGVARSAEARSSDTGVFSFFQEDNWELMVKVLDGCGINSRFWVYGAASTDVAYTLTVKDTETGAQKTYGNPLGQVAVTITDNQAFSCSPADLAAAQARATEPRPAAAASAAPAAPAAPAAAPLPGTALRHDELLAYQPQGLRRASLPAGPSSPASPAPAVYALESAPDGRVLAVSDGGGGTVLLSELREGSLAEIARVGVAGNLPLAMGAISDAAITPGGNIWLLGPRFEGPGGSPSRTLTLVDATTGLLAYFRDLPGEITAIAGGLHGLWAAAGDRLYEITPTGYFWIHHPDVLLPGWQDVDSLDVDSAGRVYFAGHRPSCAPSCTPIGVYDPRTGVVAAAPDGLPAGPVLELAIRRRCVDSPTSRCLQDGRFRAEIRYEGYDGAAGAAQAAAARSADTGIFTFFEPDNWELMVKALDGCSFNSHFWVYAAASTDVAYTLTVTDTETGRQKVYGNPLGQVALTVTDNLAFSCLP